MCGFCSEEMVLNLAEGRQGFGIGSPPLMLRFAMQESLPLTRFFDAGWSIPKSATFARMFLSRLLDLLDAEGYDSTEYQDLLGQPGFAPLLARACDTTPETAAANSENSIDAREFAWVLQPETYLAPGVFAARQRETAGGARLLDQYARWWLPEDPDADSENAWEVPDDAHLRRRSPDHALLERLFPALWAALICARQDAAACSVVRAKLVNLVTAVPPNTPPITSGDIRITARQGKQLVLRVLTDDLRDTFSQRTQVADRKLPHGADHQPLLDSGEDGLQYRSFDKAGGLPIGNRRFGEAERLTRLAGDSHDDQIAPAGVVGGA